MSRDWQPRAKHPLSTGVYPVLNAGYRKWDGWRWYKGSRDPLRASTAQSMLPVRKWLPWENTPVSFNRDPVIDPTMTITGGDVNAGMNAAINASKHDPYDMIGELAGANPDAVYHIDPEESPATKPRPVTVADLNALRENAAQLVNVLLDRSASAQDVADALTACGLSIRIVRQS